MKIVLLTQNHSREWSVLTRSTVGSGRLISSQYHRPIDLWTDGQTENTICRAAWSQLKRGVWKAADPYWLWQKECPRVNMSPSLRERSGFQIPTHSWCWKMVENTNIFIMYPTINSSQLGLRHWSILTSKDCCVLLVSTLQVTVISVPPFVVAVRLWTDAGTGTTFKINRPWV